MNFSKTPAKTDLVDDLVELAETANLARTANLATESTEREGALHREAVNLVDGHVYLERRSFRMFLAWRNPEDADNWLLARISEDGRIQKDPRDCLVSYARFSDGYWRPNFTRSSGQPVFLYEEPELVAMGSLDEYMVRKS